MLENINVEQLTQDYAIPWGINLLLAITIFIIGRIAVGIILSVVNSLFKKKATDQMLASFISAILKSLLMLIVIIAALKRLGVDTTSLVALIGAAGLAIGLALQDSLKNFASGVLLIILRPFRQGDFIEAAGISGVVEHINIFSTVMRTGDNREIIVPNGDIYGGPITNNSRRSTRRIDMVFGIGYGDDLKKAKQLLEDIVKADERVLTEPEPVIAVSELADSSVNFVVRPWVNTSDYWAVLWDITEKVKLGFDAQGVSIPFPQMDVHVHKDEN